MWLVFVSITLCGVGLSTGMDREELCYGKAFVLPFLYSPPFYQGPIYFTPSKGHFSRRIIMNNMQSNDTRFKVESLSITLTDLRETDEGTYSRQLNQYDSTDFIFLKVLDCAETITGVYGQAVSLHVPREAQYLEFTPVDGKETTVLWNRTSSQVKKGKVKIKGNIIDLYNLTQMENGYYNLRRKDNTLVKRKSLTVKAPALQYEAKENDLVQIDFPSGTPIWTVTYVPDGDVSEHTVVQNGVAIKDYYIYVPFTRRFSKWDDGIELVRVRTEDSGDFYFKDRGGNLVQTVRLEVSAARPPTYVYVIAGLLVVLVVIICCCCVKRCCCKKSSSKRSQPAPAVQRQDHTQPFVTYAASPARTPKRYQPARPDGPTQPATFSTGPSIAAPPQPTSSPAGSRVEPNFLSTDVEPTFELKGSNFPSASLLSPDSTSAYVYTSDKLNFL